MTRMPEFDLRPGEGIGPFSLGASLASCKATLPEGITARASHLDLVIEDWGLALLFDHDQHCIEIRARSGWPDRALARLRCLGVTLNGEDGDEAVAKLRNLAIDFDGRQWPSIGLRLVRESADDPPEEWAVFPPRRASLQIIGGRGVGALRLGTPASELAACRFGDPGMWHGGGRVHYPRNGLTAHCSDGGCSAIDIHPEQDLDVDYTLFPSRRSLTGISREQLHVLLERLGDPGLERLPDGLRLPHSGLETHWNGNGTWLLRVTPFAGLEAVPA